MKQDKFELPLDDFTPYKSKTVMCKTGCGNLYITLLYLDDKLHHIFIPRKSKVECDLTFFDNLRRQTTFEARRDLYTTVKDLKGDATHYCQKFNISLKGLMKRGVLSAYSCSDAVARVLSKELNV